MPDVETNLKEAGLEIEENAIKLSTWADLQSELGPVIFDWTPWLANGFLTIIAGESGNGKSILALRMAGCYLKGLPLPDGHDFDGQIGSILWAEAEAAQALNLERAVNWSLPLEKILTPFPDPLIDINLNESSHLARLGIMAELPEVKMIVVDSLSGANLRRKESDTEIMRITSWLAGLARDLKKPIILTHHLNKKREFDQDEVTLDRVRGSSGIVQHARVIWAVDTPDRTSKDQKRLSVIKNNFARFPDPLGMVINDRGIDFGDPPETPHQETQLGKAVDLLLALLCDKPIKASQLEQEAKGAGISWRTINAAKKEMGIVSKRLHDGWYWGLPAHEWGFL
jgi:putative DNA primase/helicase